MYFQPAICILMNLKKQKQKMEDDLKKMKNGRQPQKTKMGDDLKKK